MVLARSAGKAGAVPQSLRGDAKKLLQRHIAALREAERLGVMAGCAASVVHNGRLLFDLASGYADLERKVRFKHDTICRIYCMTKPYIGLVTMMLVHEGLLDLERPVHTFIPSMRSMRVQRAGSTASSRARTTMTVWHLMTHTAGFSGGVDFNYPPSELQLRYARVVHGVEIGSLRNLADFVNALAEIPLVNEPGECYEYGYATDVLGRVLEVVSGLSLEALLQKRLFEPLGMKDTSFGVPAHKVDRLAGLYANALTWGHLYGDQAAAVPVVSKPGLIRIDGDSPHDSAWLKSRVRVYSGAGLVGHNRGGLVSTANDTLAFLTFLMKGGAAPNGQQLIPQTAIAFMERNQLVGKWKLEGTRWSLMGDLIKDGRSTTVQQGGAAGNYWSLDRSRDLGIVLFMQQVDGEQWEDTPIDPKIGDIDQVAREIVDKEPKTKRTHKPGQQGGQKVRKFRVKGA